MNRHRPRARKDGNHDAIVKTFRDLGCSVVETLLPPCPGWPDLIVGISGTPIGARSELVEVKDDSTAYGRAGLNFNQTAFARDWRGSPVHLVTTPDEAIKLVQNWRRAK